MAKELTGWTGRRLIIDLDTQRSSVEEIPTEDLQGFIGGRGLNGRFFMERVDPSTVATSPENPLAFAVSPLSGTYAPCSGWTSISTISPLAYPQRYALSSLPGHWGPQLKLSGFDQLIIRGKAEKPLYLAIAGEHVFFEDAKDLRGKNTVETTIAIHEEKKDRDMEVLCTGPAGENLVLFANVTNRFSWTGDHIGLGYVFGSKNLKAIAVHGNRPILLHNPSLFLQTCVELRERIRHNVNAIRLKEKGTFLPSNPDGGFGVRNYCEPNRQDGLEKWKRDYLLNYLHGREGCFSCPIHCGRISEFEGNYFGGLHFEGAWKLGPQIAIGAWEETFPLYRLCQLYGLDPSSLGSLFSWIMDCHDQGILSSRELGPLTCQWGSHEAAIQATRWIVEKKGIGEIISQGSLRAANSLGRGLERVSHFRGMDLPVRDPRSCAEYALARGLFPIEWDYLQSLSSPLSTQVEGSAQEGILARVLEIQRRRILADLSSLCVLGVARLPVISPSDIGELLLAATGREQDDDSLKTAAIKTMEVERILGHRFKSGEKDIDPFPARLFNSPEERRRIIAEVANYENEHG